MNPVRQPLARIEHKLAEGRRRPQTIATGGKRGGGETEESLSGWPSQAATISVMSSSITAASTSEDDPGPQRGVQDQCKALEFRAGDESRAEIIPDEKLTFSAYYKLASSTAHLLCVCDVHCMCVP